MRPNFQCQLNREYRSNHNHDGGIAPQIGRSLAFNRFRKPVIPHDQKTRGYSERTAAGLAKDYGNHPTMIRHWKKALLDGAVDIFERGPKNQPRKKLQNSEPPPIENRDQEHGPKQAAEPNYLIKEVSWVAIKFVPSAAIGR